MFACYGAAGCETEDEEVGDVGEEEEREVVVEVAFGIIGCAEWAVPNGVGSVCEVEASSV